MHFALYERLTNHVLFYRRVTAKRLDKITEVSSLLKKKSWESKPNKRSTLNPNLVKPQVFLSSVMHQDNAEELV